MTPDFNTLALFRMALAAVLGGAIGYERELHGRAAGLRTHVLVCVGSALIMLTAEHLFNVYAGRANVDPGRFAAHVVSGIGFLGAGTILQFRTSVRGLTTAAGLWAAAGIGLAAGSGFYAGALGATVLVLSSLYLLTQLEWKYVRKSRYKVLTIHADNQLDVLSAVRSALSRYGVTVQDFEIRKQEGQMVLELAIYLSSHHQDDELTRAILAVPGVLRMVWGAEG
ncbi:MAG: MgtC/SapB family protein [Candidatus Omnitrophica bacterium]|nr:MgtC/SapB family protein [Candidatus Omnitrophota bacterium]